MSIRLIHITPELPPTVGGVADYAAILSRRLVEVSDGNVEPILVHAGRQPAATIDVAFPVEDLSGKCSASALAQAIQQLASEDDGQAVVLLEYSGYGYAATGAPLWLANALDIARRKSCVPVITMFHELYATGPPWSRAFWLSPLQRYVAARLAHLTSAVVTNRTSAVSWLRRYRPSAESIHVQPVFSNVGEPDACPPATDREPHMVVFGGGGRKSQVYQENEAAIRHLLNVGRFDGIIDIGPSEGLSVPDDLPVSFRGTLPPEQISRLLSSSRLGLLSYPGGRLSKSGAVSAFASHGVPFLLFDEDKPPGPAAPYVEDIHFWRWSTLSDVQAALQNETLRKMSQALRNLYHEELHSRHSASCFLEAICDALPHDQHARSR